MSEQIASYHDLSAWQRARELVSVIYEQTQDFPQDERFGLTSQIRRSAVSVPSNIAEGYGRGSAPDYLRFLRIARGSLFEVETQIILAFDLGYVSLDESERIRQKVDEVARPLSGLVRSIENQLK